MDTVALWHFRQDRSRTGWISLTKSTRRAAGAGSLETSISCPVTITVQNRLHTPAVQARKTLLLVPLLTLSFASLTICDADTSTTRVRAKLFIGSGSPRAEGPPVNSPAREGGVFSITLTRGPKARHCGCVAPSALHLDGRPIPGLTAGLFTVGPSGLNRAVRRTGRALLQRKLQREALFALGCVSLNRWTRTA